MENKLIFKIVFIVSICFLIWNQWLIISQNREIYKSQKDILAAVGILEFQMRLLTPPPEFFLANPEVKQ
jgi:hypothetical protein